MSLIAIIPLRSLHDGKRRLRHVLRSDARTALVKQLFARAHHALMTSERVAEVYVVSPDPALLAWAAQRGAAVVHQPDLGLNEGLEHARRVVIERHQPDALLVLLPDLPFVTAADVALLAQERESNEVVIAPDRHGHGTNALLLSRAAALPFSFGVDSFQRHQHLAHARGFKTRVVHAFGLAVDLDTPADLEDALNERDSQLQLDRVCCET